MSFELRDDDLQRLKEILQSKNINISSRNIRQKVERIAGSQSIFTIDRQQALFVQLLHGYEKSHHKKFIIIEELNEEEIPAVVILGVAASDWPGMSNAILGIIHHKEGNVNFVKGVTVHYNEKRVGVVILCFVLDTREKFQQYKLEKHDIIDKISEASHGSRGKTQFLEDETVKFEIYNKIIKRFMETYANTDFIRLIEESGEIQKYISSRSREYLEERDIKELANLIVNNYIYQNQIRSGEADEVIKIRNMQSAKGELTGITFVCREGWISIEDFLMTLNHIVPDHIIKHHKSFVTVDGILVYRIEIVDRNDKPLNAGIIKNIERSMEKLVFIAHSNKYAKLKAIGGFEHYARAIIPFLVEEFKKTKLSQAFFDVARRSDFFNEIKLVLVSGKSKKKRIYDLSSKVCMIPGVTILSVIPPKCYGNVEVNMIKLKVNLSEFDSIKELYKAMRGLIRKIYGEMRDFDEGFRDMYINRLNQLLENLTTVNTTLIREIFFNIDELYRLEMPMPLMESLVKLCSKTVENTRDKDQEKVIFRYKNELDFRKTLVVVSYEMQRRLMSTLIKELKEVDLYFTKIEWNQRSYLLMVLSLDKKPLNNETIKRLKNSTRQFDHKN